MTAQADTEDRPAVLTGADPVSVLKHQLEKRGSFNPLEDQSSAGRISSGLATENEPKANGLHGSSTAQNRGPKEVEKDRSDTLIVVRARIVVDRHVCQLETQKVLFGKGSLTMPLGYQV